MGGDEALVLSSVGADAVASVPSGSSAGERPWPPRGVRFVGTVERVIDGDTVVVQPLPPLVGVRLVDCWAPEIRGGSAASKLVGMLSRNHLQGLLPVGLRVLVDVETSGSIHSVLSFGRLVGSIATETIPDVSAAMVEAGFATAQKGGG